MRVLSILDIPLYKSYLDKLHDAMGFEHEVVTPSAPAVSERTREYAPDAVLLQETYSDASVEEIMEALKSGSEDAPPRTIMLCAGQAQDRPRHGDMQYATRANLKSILETLLASPEKRLPRAPARKKILFADSSKTMHSYLATVLDPTRYEILHAYDGEGAYAAYTASSPDLVLSGVQLGGMNGLELCRRIKEENTEKYIPFIVFSSSDSPLDVDTAFIYGADDYIIKTASAEALAEKVEDYLKAVDRRKHSKILLIEPQKIIRELLRHSMLKHGLQVILAQAGPQGLELALAERPEVIVADMDSSGLSGLELCEAIRSRPELSDTYLLTMGEAGRPGDLRKAEKLGVRRHFIKPFDVGKLILVVEQLLSEGYRQYKREYEHVLDSMTALIMALEARDYYTKGHTARVSLMAQALGRHMCLDEAALRDLEIAANLHDIGKIGIRDAILLKPAKLTDEEYAKIKEHAEIGAEILRPIKSLARIIPLIISHHERWDGKGYPQGVSGEAIPMGARIISIADAFDAMTSDRPYRRGMSREEALRIIQENAGTQFCPRCAAAFVEMVETSGAAFPTYRSAS